MRPLRIPEGSECKRLPLAFGVVAVYLLLLGAQNNPLIPHRA